MKTRILLLSLLALAMAFGATAQNRLTKENAQTYYAEFKKYFTDGSCSELAVPYSAMTDEELMTVLGNTPAELVDIALKVKNNSWAPREKEFRVAEYEPHSNVYQWSNILKTYQYTSLQHPTGIRATAGDTLMIFIDENLPQGMFIKMEEIVKNDPFAAWDVVGSEKYLVKGLNFITVTQPDAILFITYSITTDKENGIKLSHFPNVKIHIEGGEVNGYFDVRRHTDEDWRDMLANHFKHYSVQVKGERVLFHMELANIAKVCPNTITDAIGWWDQCLKWQHELMGADKYYDYWNNLLMARDGHEGAYMYATSNYTYYEWETIKDILPWETVYNNPGQMWGPAHEIGHINQGAINIVSCTEASNNLFSNVQLFRVGKTTTRGSGLNVCRDDFNNKIPFPQREDVIGKSRMFYQLYLYFHAAGKDTTFYPRLFEELRNDPLMKGSITNAKNDQLKFAEKCCEVAQMDLSEFFEAWGFFEPMDNVLIGDYGNYNVTLTEEDAAASRERMQQYSRKGGHLMFIEDRIKPSKRTDGVEGYRIDFNEEYAIGKMGSTGQWEDYIDESVEARGYYYKRVSNNIAISTAEDAGGALGFKLYNAETGELLDFNNNYVLRIPTAHTNSPLRVVAVQADGSDYEIPNVADSDSEEMQLEALNSVLATAKTILGKKTTGREIGYFYSDALTELEALYNSALAAAENKDTSLHTYKEWAELINNEIERLTNDIDARAYLKELDVYRIINAKEKSCQLCYDQYGLKANKSNQTPVTSGDKKWLFESTGGMHHYYIKNSNGLYINDYEIGVGTSCSGTDRSTAVVFKANYLNDGKIYFTTKKEGAYLALNSDNNVICSTELIETALWTIVRVEANNTGIENVESEEEEIIYDLTGRRIETIATPGIYIINGEKVFVK